MRTARMLFALMLIAGLGKSAVSQETADDRRKEQLRRDQLQIAAQEICPTSGQRLGEHGPPIKVRVGKETVFLCCKGCLKQKINPLHWATIHANFAKAQRICPVMKHELPKNPKWTIVEGQIVYVCCPPCTEKIAAAPGSYLRKLDELYTASLTARQSRR